jgi:hypothetical protein
MGRESAAVLKGTAPAAWEYPRNPMQSWCGMTKRSRGVYTWFSTIPSAEVLTERSLRLEEVLA